MKIIFKILENILSEKYPFGILASGKCLSGNDPSPDIRVGKRVVGKMASGKCTVRKRLTIHNNKGTIERVWSNVYDEQFLRDFFSLIIRANNFWVKITNHVNQIIS